MVLVNIIKLMDWFAGFKWINITFEFWSYSRTVRKQSGTQILHFLKDGNRQRESEKDRQDLAGQREMRDRKRVAEVLFTPF